MSALKQLKASEVSSLAKGTRKPAARAESVHWSRYRTDYATDSGYSPAFHEAVRHKPRLCGESAVMRDLIEYCNMRSYGRPRGKKDPRQVWTDLITTEELAEHCICRVREVQRQISEMEARGVIAVRRKKGGLEISLLYAAWPDLEDYAVWKRKQTVVAIDEGDGFTEDEEPAPVSKDAVPLFKRPTAVRPGRASRAAPVNVGVKEFVFVNESATVGVLLSRGVIEAGRLTLYGAVSIADLAKEKRRSVINDAESRVTPSTSTNRVSKNVSGDSPTLDSSPLPGGDLIASVFDPHLSRTISLDLPSLQKACNELGELSAAYLDGYARDRVTRGGLKGPSVVWHVVKDARLNWEKSGRPDTFILKGGKKKSLGDQIRERAARRKSCP